MSKPKSCPSSIADLESQLQDKTQELATVYSSMAAIQKSLKAKDMMIRYLIDTLEMTEAMSTEAATQKRIRKSLERIGYWPKQTKPTPNGTRRTNAGSSTAPRV